MGRPLRPLCLIAALGAALLAAMGLALTIGPAKLPLGQVPGMIASRLFPFEAAPSWTGADELILFEIRLPRIILAVLVGGALATAGTVFQGLFRNPMADPYVIGISAGAALGATIAHICHLSVPLMAFTWGLGTTLLSSAARVGSKTTGTVLSWRASLSAPSCRLSTAFLMVMNRGDQPDHHLAHEALSSQLEPRPQALIYFLLALPGGFLCQGLERHEPGRTGL